MTAAGREPPKGSVGEEITDRVNTRSLEFQAYSTGAYGHDQPFAYERETHRERQGM